MRTKTAIKLAYAAIGTTLADLIDTHPSYCPTIRPSTFSETLTNAAALTDSEIKDDILSHNVDPVASVRLGDFPTHHIYFDSYGAPGGCDLIVDEDDDAILLPGDNIPGSGSDWWDLEGIIDDVGNWQWEGEGNPKDFLCDTVTNITAIAVKAGEVNGNA